MSAAEDPLEELFWACLEELPLVGLKQKEERIFRAIVQLQYRTRKPNLRVSEKQDLSRLTGIEKQNLAEPIEALERRGMLQVWETRRGWVFQGIMNREFWGWKAAEVDRQEYYRCLNGLKALNGWTDPDPALPTMEEPEGLNEALGKIVNFVPSRSPHGVEPKGEDHARDYRHDPGNGNTFQGDNREAERVNGIEGEGAAFPVSGNAATLLRVSPNGAKSSSVIPPLIALMRKAASAEIAEGMDGSEPEVEAEPQNGRNSVLKTSTDAGAQVRQETSPVLKTSTEGSNSPPGQYLKQVPARGPVLEASTLMQCNGLKIKHCSTALIALVGRLAREGIVLDRFTSSPAQVYALIQEAGCLTGPPGTYWAKQWAQRCNAKPGAVMRALLTAMERVKEDPRGVKNLGGFMTQVMRDNGELE